MHLTVNIGHIEMSKWLTYLRSLCCLYIFGYSLILRCIANRSLQSHQLHQYIVIQIHMIHLQQISCCQIIRISLYYIDYDFLLLRNNFVITSIEFLHLFFRYLAFLFHRDIIFIQLLWQFINRSYLLSEFRQQVINGRTFINRSLACKVENNRSFVKIYSYWAVRSRDRQRNKSWSG